jgi:hypothetical protein
LPTCQGSKILDIWLQDCQASWHLSLTDAAIVVLWSLWGIFSLYLSTCQTWNLNTILEANVIIVYFRQTVSYWTHVIKSGICCRCTLPMLLHSIELHTDRQTDLERWAIIKLTTAIMPSHVYLWRIRSRLTQSEYSWARPISELGWCKTQTLASHVPDAIPMFQKTATNKFQTVKCIDESLANWWVISERPNGELAAGNG